jgi:hypothetical protein
MKSIAVPVTRKSIVSDKKKRRAGRPAGHPAVPPTDIVVGGRVGPVRAQAGEPRAVTGHRYHVGQRLRMANGGRSWSRPDTVCRVLALLPIEGGPLRYRVRSEAENFERIVDEIDLSPAG